MFYCNDCKKYERQRKMAPSKPTSSHTTGPEKLLPPSTSQSEKIVTPPRRPRLIDIIEGAKLQFGRIVSSPIDGVTGVKKVEDGWELLITLIELTRIPSSSDVLAEYAVSLDGTGEIVSYKQVQRFFRNQVGTDDDE